MRRPAPLTAETLKADTEERPQWFGLDPVLGPCWVATRGRFCRGGYCRDDYRIRGLDGATRRLSTHILAWLLDHLGPMTRDELFLAYCEVRASGYQFDHLCDEPACRRPSHLNLCTQSENITAGKERQYQRDLARDLSNPRPLDNYEPEPSEIEF